MLTRRAVRPIVIAHLAICFALTGFAVFSNGGFETGDFAGWTRATFINPGLSGAAPFHGNSIVRVSGGTDQSAIVTAAAPETGVDPQLGAAASLKFPKYGRYCARINGAATGQISNTIVQQTTISSADIDPADGLVHIRFAYAPVLEDPVHAPSEQPYFYIRVNNVTRNNALLFESLHFSNEAGVPWKKSPLNSAILYTDWRIEDIAPGNSQLSTGDVVQLEVVGADCSLGGHFGYLYVDSFGTAPLPGLTLIKAADKAQVAQGGRLTYTFTYRNSGAANATNVLIRETLPAQTSFISASDSRCSLGSGVVTCAMGTLASGASGNFQIAVNVSALAMGTISNGNYSIAADGVAPTIGPAITTPVTGAATDVSIAMTAPSTVDRPASIPYKITVLNNGPVPANDVVVDDLLPSMLAYVSVASSQGVCTGSARITCNLGTLVSGGSATVTLTTQPTTNGPVTNTAAVSGSYVDTKPANDAASATTSVRGLTIGKTGPANALKGDLITYTIIAGNGTASPAAAVILRDPLPIGTTYVSSTGGGALTNGVVVWNNGALAAGQTLTALLTVAVDSAVGSIRNQNYTNEAGGISPTTGLAVTTLVCSSLSIQPTTLSGGMVAATYPNTTFIATGGTGPYAFSLTGPLPPGITLSSDTLSGTPSTAGSYPLIVTATDVRGCRSSQQYTVVIKAACAPTSPPILGNYPKNAVAVLGRPATINPSAPPTSSVAIASVTVSAPASFTGMLAVSAATGVISVTNAAPVGAHTITVSVLDSCNQTTTGVFAITVAKSDPNNDGAVTVGDVFYLISYLFTGGPVPAGSTGPILSGDANGDGVVTVADIFYLINHLFAGGPAPH